MGSLSLILVFPYPYVTIYILETSTAVLGPDFIAAFNKKYRVECAYPILPPSFNSYFKILVKNK